MTLRRIKSCFTRALAKESLVLFFCRGRGTGHAFAVDRILREARAAGMYVEVVLVSYATGAITLRQLGYEVVDLEQDENPSLLEVIVQATQLIASLRPTCVLSHEEFGALPAAKSFDIPTLFITDWFSKPADLWMSCLKYADSIVYLDDPGVCSEPTQLSGKVQYVGPLLRTLSYSRADYCAVRRDLGITNECTVITVFILPGRRTERIAPITHLLLPAFELLKTANKRLLWLVDVEEAEHLRFLTLVQCYGCPL